MRHEFVKGVPVSSSSGILRAPKSDELNVAVDITTKLPIKKILTNTGTYVLVLAAITALPASTVYAQGFEGQPIRLGETKLTPELRVDYVSVDNAFRSSNDEQEATGIIVSPSVDWEADRRLLELNATYRGRFGQLSESSLDFTDHDLRFSLDAAPAIRHRVGLDFRFLQEAEEFGTGQSSFATGLDDQLVSTSTSLSAAYAFGARDAKGNVGGGFSILNRSYNDLGAITDGDDYTSVGPFVFFTYRLSPDTRFRLEARFLEQDYDLDSRDRSAVSLLAGLDLEATERTGGTIRLGVTESDFDASNVPNRTTFVADVNVYYRPRTHSRFDLTFNRDLETIDNNAQGVGESIVDDIRLSWRYDWTPRFSTRIAWESDRIDRDCPNIDTITNLATFDFDVNIRRWLSVGAGVGTSRRTADVCEADNENSDFEYERTSYGVHFTATL